MTSVSTSSTTGGRPSSPASQSPKVRKIARYCRRVLTDAARAAIRSASPNRLRSSIAEGMGGGEGERTLPDATAPALETSSASTSSSSASTTGASAGCSSLTANA